MKKCTYCGRENEQDAIACSECGVEFEKLPTAEPEPQSIDPKLSPVVVAKFSNLQEASLLVGRLEGAGIEAWIPEEYAEQVFSAVIGLERLTVRVAAKDYEAAMAVIAEDGQTQPITTSLGASKQTTQKLEAEGTQGRKLCVSCRTAIPYEAVLCPECGWTQPPLR